MLAVEAISNCVGCRSHIYLCWLSKPYLSVLAVEALSKVCIFASAVEAISKVCITVLAVEAASILTTCLRMRSVNLVAPSTTWMITSYIQFSRLKSNGFLAPFVYFSSPWALIFLFVFLSVEGEWGNKIERL